MEVESIAKDEQVVLSEEHLKEADSQVETDFVVYFGSQSGTAEGFAHVIKSEVEEKGDLTGRVVDLDLVTKEFFMQHRNVIFGMATHYEGMPGDNAKKFWEWFSKEEELGSTNFGKNHKFTVFALGDRTYETFAKMGKETDRLMEKYGAQRIYKLGIGTSDEGRIREHFNEWKKDIFEPIFDYFGYDYYNGNTNNSKKTSYIPFVGNISANLKEKSIIELREFSDTFNFKSSSYLNWQTLKIVNISDLKQNSTKDDFTKLVEIVGFEDNYHSGGNLYMYPKNHRDKINRMKNLLGLLESKQNLVFEILPDKKTGRKLPFPSPISTDNFLTNFIDLSGEIK